MSFQDAFRSHLCTRHLGQEAHFYPACASTQTLALESGDAPHGFVVYAEEQTHGRGRHGRRWFSGVGSLTFSLVLRPVAPPNAPHYSFVAGLGIRRGLKRLGCAPMLKWPNDLWLSGKKVGGVLCSLNETTVVVGVGINLGFDASSIDPALAKKAGSMPGLKVERSQVLASVLSGIEYELARYDALGARALLAELRPALALVGEKVRVETEGGILEGVVSGIADDFSLCLALPTGERSIQLGDVWPVEV